MPLLGGVRPPLAALLSLLLVVAAVTLLALSRVSGGTVAQAVLDEEQQIAADAAVALRTTVDGQAVALRRSASSWATGPTAALTSPDAALKSLVPGTRSAHGSALLDAGSGKLLAARGEAVPVSAVDGMAGIRGGSGDIAPRLVSDDANGPRLLYFARVDITVKASQDPNADQSQDLTNGQTQTKRRWLLVVSEPLDAPVVHGVGRGVQVVDRDGKVLTGGVSAEGTGGPSAAPNASANASAITSLDGSSPSASPTGIQRLHATPSATAAPQLGDADRQLPATAADSAAAVPHTTDASGSLLGASAGGRRTVAGWASVAAPAAGASSSITADTNALGLTVLTYRAVEQSPDAVDHMGFALEAAGALVLLALVIWGLLHGLLQRPLLRLHLSAARLVAGASSEAAESAVRAVRAEAEAALQRPVPLPLFGEPRRIGRALESMRRQLIGASGEEGGRPVPAPRFGLRAVVVACAVLVALWSLPLLFLANRVDAAAAVPADVVAAQQARTQSAADRVAASMNQAVAELTTEAKTLGTKTARQQSSALSKLLGRHKRFRSLYELDGRGRIVLLVGKNPLRTVAGTPAGSGIAQVNSGGRVPGIAAYAQIPETAGGDGRAAVLMGELDVPVLDYALTRPQLGSAYLVDAQHRVLAAGLGFEAFEELPQPGLRQLAAQAAGGAGTAGHAVSAVQQLGSAKRLGSTSSVSAATPLPSSGSAASLGWEVVSAKAAESLRLTAYQAQWRTMLAGLLGLTVAICCLGWLHVVVVRPLRALSAVAARLAGGDRRTVIYPVHHDEIGSVTRSLELLRQALARGRRRAAPPVQGRGELRAQPGSGPHHLNDAQQPTHGGYPEPAQRV